MLVCLDGFRLGAGSRVVTIVPMEHFKSGAAIPIARTKIIRFAFCGVVIDEVDAHRHHLDTCPDNPCAFHVAAVPVRYDPAAYFAARLRVALILTALITTTGLPPAEFGQGYFLVRSETVTEFDHP